MAAVAMVMGVRTLWEQSILLDYKILAGATQFAVHKVILASVSDYFRVMLNGSFLESETDFVELKGVTAVAVRNLIQFMYTDHMDLSGDNVMEILAGAVHLQMKSAVRVCVAFLINNLDIQNCLDVLTICRTYSLLKATNRVKAFIRSNAERITSEGRVHLMTYDNLYVVMEDWSRSEWHLFLCVKQWVMADYAARKEHIDELMMRIRFSIISSEDLGYIGKVALYTDSTGNWHDLVDKALQYHSSPINSKVSDKSEQTQLRSQPSVVIFSTDVNSQYASENFYALQDTWCWRRLPKMAYTSFQASAVTVNNFLVMCGGCGSSESLTPSAECHVFDPRMMEWSQIGSMNIPRKDFALVSHGSHLYALGGCTGYEAINDHMATDSVECYDFKTDTWSITKSLPVALRKHSACTYGDFIFVSGGIPAEHTVLESSCKLDCLDINTLQWESKACMFSSYYNHLMCVISQQGEEAIFVIGLDLDLEYYMPSSDNWMKYRLPLKHYLNNHISASSAMIAQANSIYFIAWRRPYSNESEDSDSDASAQFHEDICVRLNFGADGCVTLDHLPDFPIQDGKPICALLSIPESTMTDSLIVKLV